MVAQHAVDDHHIPRRNPRSTQIDPRRNHTNSGGGDEDAIALPLFDNFGVSGHDEDSRLRGGAGH